MTQDGRDLSPQTAREAAAKADLERRTHSRKWRAVGSCCDRSQTSGGGYASVLSLSVGDVELCDESDAVFGQ